MSFPTGCSSASYTTYTLHQLINDKTFSLAIPMNVNEPLVIRRHNGRIETKFLLGHPEETQNGGNKLLAILINIESIGCNPSQTIKLPYPHKRSTDGEAQDKSTSILSSEDFPGICPKIKPCL